MRKREEKTRYGLTVHNPRAKHLVLLERFLHAFDTHFMHHRPACTRTSPLRRLHVFCEEVKGKKGPMLRLGSLHARYGSSAFLMQCGWMPMQSPEELSIQASPWTHGAGKVHQRSQAAGLHLLPAFFSLLTFFAAGPSAGQSSRI